MVPFFSTSSLSLNATARDLTVQNVTLYVNDTLNESNTSGVNGQYRFTRTFADGNYTWSVRAGDLVNRTNQSGSRWFLVDTLRPAVTIRSPSTGWNNNSFIVNATIVDGGASSIVQYRMENSSVNYSWQQLSQGGTSTNWSASFNASGIPDGNYSLRINASDTANIRTRQ